MKRQREQADPKCGRRLDHAVEATREPRHGSYPDNAAMPDYDHPVHTHDALPLRSSQRV